MNKRETNFFGDLWDNIVFAMKWVFVALFLMPIWFCGFVFDYLVVKEKERLNKKGFSFGSLIFFTLIIIFSAIVLVGIPYSHQADQATEQKCIIAGYFQREKLFQDLQQRLLEEGRDKNFCYVRLAKTISSTSNIINSVFFVEKLKKDYNSFAFDLNVCKRFC